MGEIRDGKVFKIPIVAVEEPFNGLNEVYLDRWWTVDPETDSLIFYRMHKGSTLAAQCNQNERLARMIQDRVWSGRGFELRLVPRVFLPQYTWTRSGEPMQDVYMPPIRKRTEEIKG